MFVSTLVIVTEDSLFIFSKPDVLIHTTCQLLLKLPLTTNQVCDRDYLYCTRCGLHGGFTRPKATTSWNPDALQTLSDITCILWGVIHFLHMFLSNCLIFSLCLLICAINFCTLVTRLGFVKILARQDALSLAPLHWIAFTCTPTMFCTCDRKFFIPPQCVDHKVSIFLCLFHILQERQCAQC